jgi:hypothetical protein
MVGGAVFKPCSARFFLTLLRPAALPDSLWNRCPKFLQSPKSSASAALAPWAPSQVPQGHSGHIVVLDRRGDEVVRPRENL